jgi:serine/threonine protein phosphatase PrpC
MFVHTCSLLGKRESNEDETISFLNMDGANPKYAAVNLFCIFDGHGGGGISKFLKKNLYPLVLNKNIVYPISDDNIYKIFDYLQDRIINEFGSKADYMGSTALVVIHYMKHEKGYIQVINCGDSRAVLGRNSIGMQITSDLKPNEINEKARIERLGGTIEFDGFDFRVCGISVSTALGDIAATPFITHKPTIYRYKLSSSDRYLLIGCDGNFDCLSSENANEFILSQMYLDEQTNKLVCKDKRKNIAKMLGDYAIKKGSLDNISIIIVFF